jgi:hypothetical protein
MVDYHLFERKDCTVNENFHSVKKFALENLGLKQKFDIG